MGKGEMGENSSWGELTYEWWPGVACRRSVL